MASNDTGFGEVRLFDDFLGDALNTNLWTLKETSSGSGIVETENGVYFLYADSTPNDIQMLSGAEIWQPDTAGDTVFEARVKMVTGVTQGCFIGMGDDNDTKVMPIDLDTGSLTTTATSGVGFVFDSQESTTQWYTCSVKAGADGAQTGCGIGPTINVYQTFRITINSDGDCRFFIDGKEITVAGAARAAAITTSTQHCPVISQLDSGTAGDIYIDYIMVRAGRT